MSFPLLAIICVALLLAGILLAGDSFRLMAKPFDRFGAKFPGVMSFGAGALMGVFAGIIPAAIVYAVTFDRLVAGIAFGVFVLGCGAAWWRFMGR